MNVKELIDEVCAQLDRDEKQVSFSRDDAMSLLSRLTLLKNLIDKGEDKTPAQVTAMMAQRATQAERANRLLCKALEKIADPLLIPAEGVGIGKALKIILAMRKIAWDTLVALGLKEGGLPTENPTTSNVTAVPPGGVPYAPPVEDPTGEPTS